MSTPAGILDDALRAAIECRLITIGRATGQPREARVWFAALGDRLFVLSEKGARADWVRDLAADPVVRLRIEGRTFEGRGRSVEGEPDDPVAREAIAARYGTKGLATFLREGLPVRIDLEREVG